MADCYRNVDWRGSSLGTLEAGFWFTTCAMMLSGLWVAIAMDETLPLTSLDEV